MRMRLRQVAVVARDLEPVEQALVESLGLEVCFRDPGVATFGLHNALFTIGHQLLEVVSPIKEGTTAGRLLEKRGGDGGYMVILQVDDLAEIRRHLAAAEVRVAFEAAGENITGLHLHPRDVGGAILSVDETRDPLGWDDWPWAGPAWRDHVGTGEVETIAAVEIEAHDPVGMAARWAGALGAQDRLEDNSLVLDEGLIQFVEVPAGSDRGEGVSGLDLIGRGPTRNFDIGGCHIHLIADH